MVRRKEKKKKRTHEHTKTVKFFIGVSHNEENRIENTGFPQITQWLCMRALQVVSICMSLVMAHLFALVAVQHFLGCFSMTRCLCKAVALYVLLAGNLTNVPGAESQVA